MAILIVCGAVLLLLAGITGAFALAGYACSLLTGNTGSRASSERSRGKRWQPAGRHVITVPLPAAMQARDRA